MCESILNLPKQLVVTVLRCCFNFYCALTMAPLVTTLIALAPFPFVAYASDRLSAELTRIRAQVPIDCPI